jgi:hypothetical protein
MTEHFSASTDFASLFSEFAALDATELKYVIADSIEVPVADEPVVETVVEEPVKDEPVADEPVVETVAETVVEEPVAETVVEEPVKPKTRTRKSK